MSSVDEFRSNYVPARTRVECCIQRCLEEKRSILGCNCDVVRSLYVAGNDSSRIKSDDVAMEGERGS